MAKAYNKTYKISETFNAPLDYVFSWCTDFREDDSKMVGGKTRRNFLEQTKERVIWTVAYEEDGKKLEGFRVVWLRPPNSWKLDTCGDQRERGEYRLKALGKNKTRLDMSFQTTYDDKEDIVPRKDWERDVEKEWATFRRFLEKDYKQSLAASSPTPATK